MAANNTGSSAGEARPEAPYRTGYGYTSDGPTTNVYNEFFVNNTREPRNPPVAVASDTLHPAPPATAPGMARQGPASAQTQPAYGAPRQGPAMAQAAPAPGPGVVQQQPAAPPEPPPTPTAYGIPSDGPTTNVYNALFGSKNQQ